jgi:hypothetical protein
MENHFISVKNFSSYLPIVDKYTRELLGYLGDISKDGIMIVADRPIPPNQTKDILIILPDNENFAKKTIDLQVSIKWSRPDHINISQYCVGCQFANIDPNDLDVFRQRSTRQYFPVISKRPPRKHLLFYLEIIDQHTQELVGHLGDISTNGIMIIAEKPIIFNKIKDISIKLPDFEEFSKRSIDAQVEIRWMKPDTNPSLHCIGCRFLNLTPGDLPLIEQVQEVLGFYDY